MKRRQVILNAATSAIQVVITGAVLFLLYRFLLRNIGIEQLGIWSVVLGTSSLAHIANIGLSGSVVRFVARFLATGEREKVAEVIQTATISIAVLVGIFLLIAYPFAAWFLTVIIDERHVSEALAILSYSFLSLWISAVGSILQGGLEGCHRIDIKNYVLTGSAILYLMLSFALVPIYGLVGLAVAQVIEAGVSSVTSFALLRFLVYRAPIRLWIWDRAVFREMLSYGVNFQIISVASMLFEPATKAMLSKFGGLAMVGYYEMSSRMIRQFRSLIISANRVLVPTVADLNERDASLLSGLYESSYKLLFYLVLPTFSFVIVLLPVISEFWIGYYEKEFIYAATSLCLGWFFNMLAGPAYFFNLGTGHLRWNTVAHLVIAFLNIGLGVALGVFYAGRGVVLAFVISLLVGSMMIIASYHNRHHISLRRLVPRESIEAGLANLVGIAVAATIYYMLRESLGLGVVSGIIIISFLAVILIPSWTHPQRKRISYWLSMEFLHSEDQQAN